MISNEPTNSGGLENPEPILVRGLYADKQISIEEGHGYRLLAIAPLARFGFQGQKVLDIESLQHRACNLFLSGSRKNCKPERVLRMGFDNQVQAHCSSIRSEVRPRLLIRT
jgi:hypothetical protein